MPSVALFDKDGNRIGDINLSVEVFGVEVNVAVMHEAVVNYLANQRQGTQSTKTVSQVRGGGRKPWRQKGTGRARQGGIRRPQWRGGGVALGPKPRDYSYNLNKKTKRLALKCALSSKVLKGELLALDSFDMDLYKTKDVARLIKNLKISDSVLIVLPNNNSFITRSADNISHVSVTYIGMINTYEILKHRRCVVLSSAINMLEEVYGK